MKKFFKTIRIKMKVKILLVRFNWMIKFAKIMLFILKERKIQIFLMKTTMKKLMLRTRSFWKT